MLDIINILLASFIPCFRQQRTWQYLIEFFWGIVSEKRNTVTNIYLSAEKTRHYTNFYRFLKKYKWNVLSLAKRLIEIIQESLHMDNRTILVLDSTFSKKSGKKIDGVDSFFDHSSKPNAPKYVWGHCVFILGVLHRLPCLSWICVPFYASVYLRKKTVDAQRLATPFVSMLDKSVNMILSVKDCFKKETIVVADAFFSKKTFFKPLEKEGIHTLSRCRKDAIAFEPAPKQEVKRRGRPKIYGNKVKLKDLVARDNLHSMTIKVKDKELTLEYEIVNLFVKGYAKLARFLVIKDKTVVILMSTKLDLSAKEMLETYCARFQIEFSIRELKQNLGFEEYQVRRFEAIEKFLNIIVMVYSLLKITFFANKDLQDSVRKLTDQPWRDKAPVFSFEQLLSIIRNEIMTRRFFDASGINPEQENIPSIENISTEKTNPKR